MRTMAAAGLAALAFCGTAAAQATSQDRVTPNMAGGAYSATNDYNEGFEALSSGRYKEAAQSFDRLVRRGPPDATLLTLYGQALEGLKADARAEEAFRRALQLNPKQLLARREHALVLLRLGRAEEARGELAVLAAEKTACDEDCSDAAALAQAVHVVQAALAAQSPTG